MHIPFDTLLEFKRQTRASRNQDAANWRRLRARNLTLAQRAWREVHAVRRQMRIGNTLASLL